MPDTEDLGFVAPEILDALPEVEPAEEADPLDELLDSPPDPEDAPEGEVFQNLEDEYRVLASLRRRRDDLKAEHAAASREYEAHRSRMQRAMLAQGTRQFRSTTVENGSCNFSSQYQARIKDPVAFLDWAKKNAEELLSVNSRTLTRHLRERYLNRGIPPEDESFPPGLEVTERETLTVNVPKERTHE